MEDFGFYLVMTDPVVGYERCCEAAVRAGVRMVQLRMKDAPRAEIVSVARRLRLLTRGTDTKFIVNDDPSIAAEVGADGVHVGQDDMPVGEVRRRYPELGIVGLSTHSPAQALASLAVKPDYIGVGPVFATPTKKIPDPTLGVATAVRMVASVPYPAVAIGGLDFATIPAVLAAGVRNFAVVRAVCGSSDPEAAIRRIQRMASTPR
ncbi:MAG: thiamine phosphate synthase [Kiritimatiellia bacterium]